MSLTQTETRKKRTVQVRLPEALMGHIEQQTGSEGQFADASDYIRDLIRHDAQSHEGYINSRLDKSLNDIKNGRLVAFSGDLRQDVKTARAQKD